MTAYRNLVFAGEFQHLVCFVQRDLGHGVIAGFCHVLLGQCQIQHAVRFQFVAQRQAVVVLFDEILGGTGGNGVVALHLYPLSRSCLCGGNLIVVVCAVGIGVDHFDRHVLLTAALVHGTGRDLVALSGSHDSGQGAAGSTPVGGAVIAVQGSAAVVGLLRGQGQRGAYAFPCSVAAFERVVHQLLHLCGADQSRKGQTGDSKHTGGDCRHEFFEFHLISFLLSDFRGFCASIHVLLQ